MFQNICFGIQRKEKILLCNSWAIGLVLWIKCSALWVKILAHNILKYFSYFSQKLGFVISSKLRRQFSKLCDFMQIFICMKCKSLFSGINKKNISRCSLLKETICMKCQSLFSGKIRKIFQNQLSIKMNQHRHSGVPQTNHSVALCGPLWSNHYCFVQSVSQFVRFTE